MESCACGGFWTGFEGGGGGGGRAGSAAEPAPSVVLPTPASVLLSSSSTSIGSPGPGTSAILSETKRVGGRKVEEGTRRQLPSAFNCWPEAREAAGLCSQSMDAADFKNGPRLTAQPMPAEARRCRTVRDDLHQNNPRRQTHFVARHSFL